jgi:Zn-dependent alcohol dehydrogenase
LASILHLVKLTKPQAGVAWEAGKDLSVEDIEVAPPKAHEVRIEIYYTGVCHTGEKKRSFIVGRPCSKS